MQFGVTVRVSIHNRQVLLSVMMGRVTPPSYDIPVRADCQRCAQRKNSLRGRNCVGSARFDAYVQDVQKCDGMMEKLNILRFLKQGKGLTESWY